MCDLCPCTDSRPESKPINKCSVCKKIIPHHRSYVCSLCKGYVCSKKCMGIKGTNGKVCHCKKCFPYKCELCGVADLDNTITYSWDSYPKPYCNHCFVIL